MHRRHWPTAFGLLAALILGWYLLYTELVIRQMRRDAGIVGQRALRRRAARATEHETQPGKWKEPAMFAVRHRSFDSNARAHLLFEVDRDDLQRSAWPNGTGVLPFRHGSQDLLVVAPRCVGSSDGRGHRAGT